MKRHAKLGDVAGSPYQIIASLEGEACFYKRRLDVAALRMGPQLARGHVTLTQLTGGGISAYIIDVESSEVIQVSRSYVGLENGGQSH